MARKTLPHPLTFHDFPNLYLVPYVRGRLMFAQAAAHAAQSLKLDMVAIDLPGFLQNSEFLNTALSVFPLTTALLINHPANKIRMLPFTVADAASIAAHQAWSHGITLACIDDGFVEEWPSDAMEFALPDDCVLPAMGFDGYFREVWQGQLSKPDSGYPAARRIAYRLQRLMAAHTRVLFVCDWKRWPFIQAVLRRAQLAECQEDIEAPAALIFEDPQQLWNCGYMDDFPALNLLLFKHVQAGTVEEFDKQAGLISVLHKYGCAPEWPRDRTPQAATGVLEEIDSRCGHETAARLARDLLDCPLPTLIAAAALLPAFGTIKNGRIEESTTSFSLLDPFHAIPYYPFPERHCFYAPAELEQRNFWGPGPKPWISRVESKISPGSVQGGRWSIPPNFAHYAQIAREFRRKVREAELNPPLGTGLDEFTPVVFVLGLESDGDVRSVEDVNSTARKRQLGLDVEPEQEPKADSIHTLLATRRSVVPLWCSHAVYDDETSIALLYSGPEPPGPERYDMVVRRLRPEQICRTEPFQDSELCHFPPLEVCSAWAVRWAPAGIVLIAACEGWRPSQELVDLARRKEVRMIIMPLSVIPRNYLTRLRRRVFVSQTLRFHPGGERLRTRLAEWRV